MRWSQGEIDAIRQAFHEAARRAVKLAVQKGELDTQPCSVCGARGRMEGHHYKGYNVANWLEVLWLCPKHHLIAERTQRDCDCVVCALVGKGGI